MAFGFATYFRWSVAAPCPRQCIPCPRRSICEVVAFYVPHGLIHHLLFALPDAPANDFPAENAEPYLNLKVRIEELQN